MRDDVVMSIVTILATTKYISAMSDGRITRDDGTVYTENYPKVLGLNKNTFIAFTGRVEYFEALLSVCNFDSYNNYEDISAHIYEKFLGIPSVRNHKLIIVVGGKGKNSEIGFYYFSSRGNKPTHVKPEKDNGVNHLLLVNPEFGARELLGTLLKTIGFDTVTKAIDIQKQIHDYEAVHDITVNAEKYSITIEK